MIKIHSPITHYHTPAQILKMLILVPRIAKTLSALSVWESREYLNTGTPLRNQTKSNCIQCAIHTTWYFVWLRSGRGRNPHLWKSQTPRRRGD